MLNQHASIQVKSGSTWHKVCPFPLGFIYYSTNSTSPATHYGGTWAALKDSRFLRPSDSWNSTGGAATVKLTVAQMPVHSHDLNFECGWEFDSSGGDRMGYARYYYGGRPSWEYTASTGKGSAHENLPPYRTCYAWYRTA